MNTEIVIGLSLGILIGVVTGVVCVILIRTMVDARNKSLTSLLTIIGEFLAIPLFIVGGPWVTGELLTPLLEGPGQKNFLAAYLATLTIVFVGIAIIPIGKLILRLATEIGESSGTTDE